MVLSRVARRARVLIVAIGFLALAAGTSGCDVVNDLIGGDEPETGNIELERISRTSFGGCLTAIGDRVTSFDLDASGNRALFVSGTRPPNLPDDVSWQSEDRAIYVLEFSEDSATRPRYVARSWEAGEEVSVYASPRPGQTAREPGRISEIIRSVQLSDDGERLVVGVTTRQDGPTARLYTGIVPSGEGEFLSPEDEGGLAEVPVNAVMTPMTGGEERRIFDAIKQWHLSPDGQKVAAVVGVLNELRVYDLAADQHLVYSLDEQNEIVVNNEPPAAMTNLSIHRRPALRIAAGKLNWSPDSTRIAISRDRGIGTTELQLLDVATGGLTLVRTFENSTLPQVAWSADGQSLFVMTTPLNDFGNFGDTAIRQIAAAAGGEAIGDPIQIFRQPDWRTEPANLINFGDDSHFMFTWEGDVYRLDAPGGQLDRNERPIQITSFPEDVVVLYDPAPAYGAVGDRAVFRLLDGSRLRLGERTSASEDSCPAGTLEEGDAPR